MDGAVPVDHTNARMDAQIVCIGSELTSGRVVNTNAARLARVLASLGYLVRRVVAAGDERGEIISVLRQALRESAVVIITGGLGPTGDDITRESFAEAVGTELALDDLAFEKIKARFAARGMHMPATNRKQALFPKGSKRLENPVGTADGWTMEVERARAFVLPGVPDEMEAMIPAVVKSLASAGAGAGVERTLRLFGISESAVDETLGAIINAEGNPEVGTMAEGGIISVRILARGKSRKEADALADEMESRVRRLLSDHIFGCDAEGLEHAVTRELERTARSLAVAESCTGGLISHMLTNVPGISRYFLEGVVAYSNEAKRDILGVSNELIRKHGGVSEPVAMAMARGARARSGAAIAAAVTGIAGPAGGTEEKPVGLCYIATSDASGERCSKYNFGGSRMQIKDRAAKMALYLLWTALRDS